MERTLEQRVDRLEDAMAKAFEMLYRLEANLNRLETEVAKLQKEMREFKDEMLEFKNEMREFKDEMREFKDEMREFKDEMREETRKLNKHLGGLANKMGRLVEDIISPAFPELLEKYWNCSQPDDYAERRKMRKGEHTEEFDLFVRCSKEKKIFIVETKSSPKVQHIDELLEKKERFEKVFGGDYEGYEVEVVFGVLNAGEDLLRYASRRGVYVMAFKSWDYVDILNFDEVES